MKKRILLVGGGSGGHVYPLIGVAQSLQEIASQRGINLELKILGDGKFIERAARDAGIPFSKILAGKLRRYFSIETILDILKVPLSFLQSLWHLFIFMPDIVFSKGGYSSIMPVVVAKLFFIPVYIHESDSAPGLANVILSKMAKMVFISFKNSERAFSGVDTVYSGNPIRSEILKGDKELAREYFNLAENRKTILIMGGSQGAQKLNETVLSSLVVMTEKYQIIHQTGQNNFASVKDEVVLMIKEGAEKYGTPIKNYYRCYPFFNPKELAQAYAMADIIVSRAGAGSLFEIAALGKPSIIIPIMNSPANHQYLNAFEFNLSGGSLIEESNLNREMLVHEINALLKPEHYASASEKIKAFATPNAADIIANELLK